MSPSPPSLVRIQDLKRGGILFLGLQAKKRVLGGGPILGPMLRSLQRGPNGGGGGSGPPGPPPPPDPPIPRYMDLDSIHAAWEVYNICVYYYTIYRSILS